MKHYSFLTEIGLDPVTGAMVKDRTSSIKKVGRNVLAVGGAGYLIFQSGLNIIFAKKITEMLRMLRDPGMSREECANIVTQVGYSIDKYGVKSVKPMTVKYLFSANVVGPTIQIIKNEDDEKWFLSMIKYLKNLRKFFIVKSIGTAGMGGLALTKLIKK